MQINEAIESQVGLLFQGGSVCRDDFFCPVLHETRQPGISQFLRDAFLHGACKKNDPRDFIILFSSI